MIDLRPVLGAGAALLVGAVAVSVVWGQREHDRVSRIGLGSAPGPRGGSEVIVVLGYGNRGDRANGVNRWRVRTALGARDAAAAGSALVLSGGPVHSDIPEAELMARYLRQIAPGVEPVLEPASRSTWENVRNVIPFLESADRIKIVSHAFHAAKARLYLRRMRPDLADRLVAADDHPIGSWTLLTPVLAVMGRRALRDLD